MDQGQWVAFDEGDVARLRAAYEDAVRRRQVVFTFDGHELMTAYARYLLEYLDIAFERVREEAERRKSVPRPTHTKTGGPH
jgi:hypothetical protein